MSKSQDVGSVVDKLMKNISKVSQHALSPETNNVLDSVLSAVSSNEKSNENIENLTQNKQDEKNELIVDTFHLNNQLGMSFIYEDKFLGENLRVFLPLNGLKHIVSNSKYEKINFHQSWLRGFTHFRSENISVIDLQNLFNPQTFMPQDVESRLIIAKDYENMRYAIIGRDVSLINLEKQYYAMSITQQEPEVEISIDTKLLDILKKSSNMDYSVVALNPVDKQEQPSYLSLSHIQHYSKIYSLYLNHVNRFCMQKDYKKIDNFCILVFASSFFIDEAGVLGIVIDMQKFNHYLYSIN